MTSNPDAGELAPDGAPVERDTGRHTPGAEVEPAAVPLEVTRCPTCGARPTEQSITSHRLSDMGYLHDDVRLACSSAECERTWVLGIPLGEPEREFYDDLVCGCGAVARVHRVRVVSEYSVRLHLKCPRCFAFFQTSRHPGDGGLALIGDPSITGATDGAEPWGYGHE